MSNVEFTGKTTTRQNGAPACRRAVTRLTQSVTKCGTPA
jgi:hypothetical protein